MWHRSVAGLFPASVGPAVKAYQLGGWGKRDGTWKKFPTRSSGGANSARTLGGGATSATGLQVMKCPGCDGDFVSGSVFCESCGGPCFYASTVEENDAFVVALSAWLQKNKQPKPDESQEEERRRTEEKRQLKASEGEIKMRLYGSHGAHNPMPNLRKLTAKLRKHRCAWEMNTPESDEYRRYSAEHGGTHFSVMRHRTKGWEPEGPWDNPPDTVLVTAVDIAHYFYSALLDSDGLALKDTDLTDGPGKALWHAITAACFEEDYAEIAQRIIDSMSEGDYDAFLA